METSNKKEEPIQSTEGIVLGKWGTRFRTLCGIIAVLTTCWVSYSGMGSIVESVKAGKGWPSDMTVFLITFGPIAIAWQYMSVNKLLSLLFSSNDPNAVNLKDRLRGFLEPNTKPQDSGKAPP
ncbi:hypothetical protein [Vibrio phage pTD1]|uniref:Phage protein n=1 Tax=Vibrio phage pTD1 TaxID=1938577 RepID=A0A1Q2U2S6_9CAUD|nr:hypothetical protein FDH33_gp051 [Vibrio phage pTD1]BAW98260.1 hypothetical protein [Vibrio phage pTD1]